MSEIAQELERIARSAPDGVLTPSAVVESARDEGSPLHDKFEWDDGVAAEAWRLEQARRLIRTVKVVVETTERTLKTVQYVRHPDVDRSEQGYAAFEFLLEHEDSRQEVLAREFRLAVAAMKRARDLAAAFDLAQQVDAVIRQIDELQMQLQRAPEERLGVVA